MINTMALPSRKEITDHKLWKPKTNSSIWMKSCRGYMMCIHVGDNTVWELGEITNFDSSLIEFHGKVVIEEN